MEIEIKVSTKPEYFREIYFKNGIDHYIGWGKGRIAVKVFIYSVLVTGGILFLSKFYENYSWLLVISFLGILAGIIAIIITFSKYYKWKHEIIASINEIMKYKVNKLILSDGAIELVRDDQKILMKWSEVKSANIQSDHMFIFGNPHNFIFPAKGMQPEEYDLLRTTIEAKIKDQKVQECDAMEARYPSA